MARVATAPTPPADIRLMNITALIFAVLGAVALVVVAIGWVVKQPVFAVRAIRVEGDMAHNSVVTIRANAMPKLAGNFFTMDLGVARRAFEAVPWVRQAVVRRVWPNRLSVQLEEHRTVALWISAASSDETPDKLVNSFGDVFEANLGDVEDDALPTLRGPDGSSAAMLSMLNRLVPVFAPMEAHIDTLSLSGRGSWHALLDSGAEIELGRCTDDEVIARTEAFIATLPQVTGHFQRALQTADLRHRDGYAVRLKGVSTSANGAAKPPRK